MTDQSGWLCASQEWRWMGLAWEGCHRGWQSYVTSGCSVVAKADPPYRLIQKSRLQELVLPEWDCPSGPGTRVTLFQGKRTWDPGTKVPK